MYYVVTTEIEKTETNSLPAPKRTAPVQLPLDDDNFPDEKNVGQWRQRRVCCLL